MFIPTKDWQFDQTWIKKKLCNQTKKSTNMSKNYKAIKKQEHESKASKQIRINLRMGFARRLHRRLQSQYLDYVLWFHRRHLHQNRHPMKHNSWVYRPKLLIYYFGFSQNRESPAVHVRYKVEWMAAFKLSSTKNGWCAMFKRWRFVVDSHCTISLLVQPSIQKRITMTNKIINSLVTNLSEFPPLLFSFKFFVFFSLCIVGTMWNKRFRSKCVWSNPWWFFRDAVVVVPVAASERFQNLDWFLSCC